MGLTCTSAPALVDYPVTLEQVKHFIGLFDDDDDHDDLITLLLKAAYNYIESFCGIAVAESEWLWKGSCIPYPFFVPMAPLKTVDYVKYYDSNNTLQTLTANTDYFVTIDDEINGRIFMKEYPSTYDRPDCFQIAFTAGRTQNLDSIALDLMNSVYVSFFTRGHDQEKLDALHRALAHYKTGLYI